MAEESQQGCRNVRGAKKSTGNGRSGEAGGWGRRLDEGEEVWTLIRK